MLSAVQILWRILYLESCIYLFGRFPQLLLFHQNALLETIIEPISLLFDGICSSWNLLKFYTLKKIPFSLSPISVTTFFKRCSSKTLSSEAWNLSASYSSFFLSNVEETLRFSDVFRGYRKSALGTNGLKYWKWHFFYVLDVNSELANKTSHDESYHLSDSSPIVGFC